MKRLVCFILFLPAATFAQDSIKRSEFKPSGKIWGYAFGDAFYKIHADSSGRGGQQYSGAAFPKDHNALEFRRIYLGYDHNISEKFSSEFLLSYEGQTLSDNATRTVFIKSANLRWKNIFKNTDLVIGQQQTPCFSMIGEKLWGYRSVEKTVSDMRKVCSSNDVGIGLQIKFDSKGNYGTNLMVGNGTAQKIEFDKFKRMYGDLYAKFMNQHIVVHLYGDYERSQLTPFHKSKMTMKATLAYTTDKFTVGAELFQQTQENYSIFAEPVPSTNIDTTQIVVAGAMFYIRGTIIKDKMNFFVRADMYDPDTKYNNDNTYSSGYTAYNMETFFAIGVDLMPVKNVHIIPNIWFNAYSSRIKNVKGLAKDDYDMVARLTFHYIFK